MLFSDILKSKTEKLKPEFDKLFNEILKNQNHIGDLLLVKVNGLYNPEVYNWDNLKEKLSPYMIGPNVEGHSEHLHYEFIDNYRKQAIYEKTYTEYLNENKWSKENREEIETLVWNESMSIQLEMLVYLKVWESDMFIKKLFQLTRLVHGEEYDWHFSISESNRDNNKTGTREKIIRKKIRDRLQNNFPEMYSAIKNAYKTQIRNSIAHSKYSFIGRNFQLNNYIENDKASQLKGISFDTWIDIFHDTMVIYNLLIRLFNNVGEYYEKESKKNNSLVEVRINRKETIIKTEHHFLKYHPALKDWGWNKNDK